MGWCGVETVLAANPKFGCHYTSSYDITQFWTRELKSRFNSYELIHKSRNEYVLCMNIFLKASHVLLSVQVTWSLFPGSITKEIYDDLRFWKKFTIFSARSFFLYTIYRAMYSLRKKLKAFLCNGSLNKWVERAGNISRLLPDVGCLLVERFYKWGTAPVWMTTRNNISRKWLKILKEDSVRITASVPRENKRGNCFNKWLWLNFSRCSLAPDVTWVAIPDRCSSNKDT